MTPWDRQHYTQLIMDVAAALADFHGGEITFHRVYQAAQALSEFVPREFQGDPRDYVELYDQNHRALTPAERRAKFRVVDSTKPV